LIGVANARPTSLSKIREKMLYRAKRKYLARNYLQLPKELRTNFLVGKEAVFKASRLLKLVAQVRFTTMKGSKQPSVVSLRKTVFHPIKSEHSRRNWPSLGIYMATSKKLKKINQTKLDAYSKSHLR
jgi:hypothetical protein